MVNRNYSSVARLASLTADITNSATTMSVDNTTGYPSPPFTLVVDPGRTGEEAVTCTAVAGLNLTVLRAQDGTAGQPHSAGASVRHMATARDYAEPQAHIAATTNIHGITGALAGILTAQVFDNKTYTPVTTDHVPLILQLAAGQTSHMLDVRDSSSSVLGFLSVAGRWSVPGIDGLSSSTFTSGGTTTTALIAKAVSGQTTSVFSVRDNTNTEVFGVPISGIIGTLNATLLQVATITATGRIATVGVDSSSTSVFSTTATGVIPLQVKVPAAGTVSGLTIMDNETVTRRAGVTSGATGYQLYHGGAQSNLVPFKIHCGQVNVTIVSGATSQGGTVDLTPYNFTQTPIVSVTAKQNTSDTSNRRVAANIESLDSGTLGFRIIQTAATGVSTDVVYAVQWIAIQATPSSGAG